ncbi:hypothetical protein EDB86DRAFT_2829162 [Lactarius hatsudake]|nr:hypothetical protein EDB86DRAFT_2829162 [Lactarius hatsudake]
MATLTTHDGPIEEHGMSKDEIVPTPGGHTIYFFVPSFPCLRFVQHIGVLRDGRCVTTKMVKASERDTTRRMCPSHLKTNITSASSSASPSPPPTATSNQVEEDRSQEVSDPSRAPDLSPSHPRRLLPDAAGHSTYRSSFPSDSDPQPQSEDEEQIPPKMRKRRIHRSMEGLPPVSPSVSPCGSNISLGSVLDEGQTEVDLVCSDMKDMLAPPMPANLDATTVSSIPHSSSPRMDVDKDPYDSQSTRHPPLLNACSPSPQSLTSSEPLWRVQHPPMSQVDSPRPASPSRQTSSVLGPLSDAEPPPAPSSPRIDASSPSPSLQAGPKVKMSLKEFAMRKKKEREEEQARGAVLPSAGTPREA